MTLDPATFQPMDASSSDPYLDPDPELVAAFLMLLDRDNGLASLREAVKKRNWAVVHRDTLASLEKQIAMKVNSHREYWNLQLAAAQSLNTLTTNNTSGQPIVGKPYPKAPYLPK